MGQTRGRESAARRPQRTRSRGPALGSGGSRAVHLAPSLAQEEAEVTAAKAMGSILMPQARLRSCAGVENSNQPDAWLEVVQRSLAKAWVLGLSSPTIKYSVSHQEQISVQALGGPLGSRSPQSFYCLETPSHPHGQDRSPASFETQLKTAFLLGDI